VGERIKFGDVVRLRKETCREPAAQGIQRYIGLEHLVPGDLRVGKWGEVSEGTTFTNRVRPGQVLFGKRRAYQRKVAVADFDAVCSGDIYVFESADPARLLPELLPFICQTEAFFEHAVGTSAGSLSPRTNWTSLASYEFTLPPLGEQRRRVSLLKSFQLARNEFDLAKEAVMAVRDRLQIEMCKGASQWISLSECAGFITSGPRGWSKYYADTGEAFLRVGNLNSPTIELNLSEVQRVRAPKDAEAQRTRVRSSDVLLGITGEAGVGLVGLVRRADEPTFISQHVAIIRVADDRYSPEFIAHVLAGPAGQRQIMRYNQAGTKGGMTLMAVRELKIPSYSLRVQRYWAERASAAERAFEDLASRRERLTEVERMSQNAALSTDAS
jgi:type I restriction enzyme S subunit